MALEDLFLSMQRQMIPNLETITCANTLAPAVLFSIGCAGLSALFIVQSQAYFSRTSSITFITAG